MPGLQLASENTTLQLHRSSDQQENQSLLADPAGGLTLPQLPGIYGCRTQLQTTPLQRFPSGTAQRPTGGAAALRFLSAKTQCRSPFGPQQCFRRKKRTLTPHPLALLLSRGRLHTNTGLTRRDAVLDALTLSHPEAPDCPLEDAFLCCSL